VLSAHGVTSEVHEDVDAALRALPGTDLLVVNALRWTMAGPGTPDHYRDRAAAEGVSPSPDGRAAFAAHLSSGGSVLGVHTAAICFDDWPEWGAALGGAWRWGTSFHPPLGEMAVEVAARTHPLVTGVPDFPLIDECYSDMDLAPDLEPLLVRDGRPLLWAREHGGGRVVYDALGHHPPSYAVPEHREILNRCVDWLLEDS
jgi:type 1 glutamine amidotransferase